MSHSLHGHQSLNGHAINSGVNGHTNLTSQDVSIMLSPETALPPPPSPPCTCGKVRVFIRIFRNFMEQNDKPKPQMDGIVGSITNSNRSAQIMDY